MNPPLALPSKTSPPTHGPDLFSLASGSMRDLVDALTLPAIVPADARQVARLVLAEAVRLIRLSSIKELSTESARLAKLSTGRRGEQLRASDDESHRLVTAASIVLGAAASPSSRGAEMAVLRSWNGKPEHLLALVAAAPGGRLPRGRLREMMGMQSSNLSHMLASLEDAGLIMRIRSGRETDVVLGARALVPHVRQRLDEIDLTASTAKDERTGDAEVSAAPKRLRTVPRPASEVLPHRGRPIEALSHGHEHDLAA